MGRRRPRPINSEVSSDRKRTVGTTGSDGPTGGRAHRKHYSGSPVCRVGQRERRERPGTLLRRRTRGFPTENPVTGRILLPILLWEGLRTPDLVVSGRVSRVKRLTSCKLPGFNRHLYSLPTGADKRRIRFPN